MRDRNFFQESPTFKAKKRNAVLENLSSMVSQPSRLLAAFYRSVSKYAQKSSGLLAFIYAASAKAALLPPGKSLAKALCLFIVY